MKVFVSSTVFDLLDIRAELESHLRSLQMTPVLSDSATSDFVVDPSRNSIETCLVNVDACDAVLVILDRRYGGDLAKAGFGAKSATELEYERAMEIGKPTYVYVRDRLEADYRLWRSETDPSKRAELGFSWVRSKNDRRLFEFLNAHQQLDARSARNNWYSTFRDSIELKTLVARDIGASASRAHLEALLESGSVPCASVIVSHEMNHDRYYDLWLTIKNVGAIPMIDVWWECGFEKVEHDKRPQAMAAHPWLATGQSFAAQIDAQVDDVNMKSVTLNYSMPTGHRVRDHYNVKVIDPTESYPNHDGPIQVEFYANLVRRSFAPRPSTASFGFQICDTLD